MNIKKVDKEKYLSEIEKYTTISELNMGKQIKTIDYDYNYINYLVPEDLFLVLDNMVNSFISSKNVFTIKSLENYLHKTIFEVYRKNIASKKITTYFINTLLLNNKISTENFYDFEIN